MTTLYVLDIPEFGAFVEAAENQDMTVRRAGDYVEVTTDGPLEIQRAQVGARPAIWFAALTAGYQGRLVTLDEDRLLLVEK
ncbi:hypothetical protein [Streptomyces camelliae]|uniref:Uncharacterized protein n=1 Tax=Streptomyces camelliae TaxID=3004093 RepID=A0ABY7P3A6_9ACTN|nr:hypothetical protein [Streptomyces sp. HUAS 2-6]WBO65001.1 hypothetical protein O1G22_20270 [Streptomyces sp. HUAS 2-6]